MVCNAQLHSGQPAEGALLFLSQERYTCTHARTNLSSFDDVQPCADRQSAREQWTRHDKLGVMAVQLQHLAARARATVRRELLLAVAFEFTGRALGDKL